MLFRRQVPPDGERRRPTRCPGLLRPASAEGGVRVDQTSGGVRWSHGRPRRCYGAAQGEYSRRSVSFTPHNYGSIISRVHMISRAGVPCRERTIGGAIHGGREVSDAEKESFAQLLIDDMFSRDLAARADHRRGSTISRSQPVAEELLLALKKNDTRATDELVASAHDARIQPARLSTSCTGKTPLQCARVCGARCEASVVGDCAGSNWASQRTKARQEYRSS
jgi:hypothetical protein